MLKKLWLFLWLLCILLNSLVTVEFDYITLAQIETAMVIVGLWIINKKHSQTVFKSILSTLSIYYVWVAISDSFINYMPQYMLCIESLVFFLILSFQLHKKVDLKSDKITKSGIYLIFFKPKTFFQYFISLFGLPYASMGSIINGKVYRLKHNKSNIICSIINKRYIENNYHIVKVGDIKNINNIKDVEEELLKQSAYSPKRLFTRTNCVESQKPLLDNLNKKWHTKYIFDFIPAVYIYKRLKG